MSRADHIWQFPSHRPGPRVCISFGVHGNERPPIDAGLRLSEELARHPELIEHGDLLLIHSNPKGSEQDSRWSEGGVDLNRCFDEATLSRTPELYEEQRAHEIVQALEDFRPEILVDFHCTVEPGERFLMHHPAADDAAHRAVTRWLRAEVVLADPHLHFGGVSLDEWMSTRGKVGICYETGWIGDAALTPESVHGEMLNVLRGVGLVEGEAQEFSQKRFLELEKAHPCEEEGFRWEPGMGNNLQEVARGSVLGKYASGGAVTMEQDVTLIFPKKKPELVQLGKPLVYLAARKS